MIIGVTGASGFLGSQVADTLRTTGHEVHSFDRVAARDGSGVVVDLKNPSSTRDALRGCEGIVHLAGYPRAGNHTPHDVFTTNTGISYSVVDAALEVGVSLIAFVSSISVIGYPFYAVPIIPAHLPLDEDIHTLPQDPYGLSKWVGEEIISSAVQRSGRKLAAVSLRFPALHTPESFVAEMPATYAAGKDRKLLWSYIDNRDASAAIAAVFDRQNTGHNAFFVAANDTFNEHETAYLLDTYFPGIPTTRELPGYSALLSNEAACQYLDFMPQYSWRSYPGVRSWE